MQLFLSVCKIVGGICFLLFLAIGSRYILPSPFSTMHVGTVVAISYILVYERGRIIWYIFAYAFLLEVLFPLPVYGAYLFASPISVLIAYWSHKFFLIHRSIYTGMLLGVIALVTYRILWFLYMAVASLSHASRTIPDISGMLLLTELLVTEGVIALVFLLFVKRRVRV